MRQAARRVSPDGSGVGRASLQIAAARSDRGGNRSRRVADANPMPSTTAAVGRTGGKNTGTYTAGSASGGCRAGSAFVPKNQHYIMACASLPARPDQSYHSRQNGHPPMDGRQSCTPMSDDIFAQRGISRIYARFAIPSVLTSLLMISTYIVDGILIGQFIGTQGLASFNLVFPIFSFLAAAGIVIATGGSAIIGRHLGGKSVKNANQAFNLALILTGIFAAVFTTLTLGFADDITGLLGASEILAGATKEYMTVLSYFFILFLFNIVLQYFIRNEGNSTYPIKTVLVSVGINIPLTYLFLGVLDMGLGAAALGSGISLVASTILLFAYFAKKGSVMSYGRPLVSFSVIRGILYNGSSEGLSEFSAGIVVLVFNLTLIRYLGEVGIAAFAIISLTSLILIMINFGLSMALQPMVSYYFGARSPENIRSVLRVAVKIALVVGAAFYGVIFFFGHIFIGLFSAGDDGLRVMAFDAIRIYGLSYLFLGINYLSSGYLSALQKPRASLAISISYNLVFVIIGLVTFPHLFGSSGIWWAVPFANIASILISVYFVRRQNKKLT